jgi:hypothetical protein
VAAGGGDLPESQARVEEAIAVCPELWSRLLDLQLHKSSPSKESVALTDTVLKLLHWSFTTTEEGIATAVAAITPDTRNQILSCLSRTLRVRWLCTT